MYTAGWLATGPTGVILSTMTNAFETGAAVAEDVHKKVLDTTVPKPGFAAISGILKRKGKTHTRNLMLGTRLLILLSHFLRCSDSDVQRLGENRQSGARTRTREGEA